jgi:hypothetical protein
MNQIFSPSARVETGIEQLRAGVRAGKHGKPSFLPQASKKHAPGAPG